MQKNVFTNLINTLSEVCNEQSEIIRKLGIVHNELHKDKYLQNKEDIDDVVNKSQETLETIYSLIGRLTVYGKD